MRHLTLTLATLSAFIVTGCGVSNAPGAVTHRSQAIVASSLVEEGTIVFDKAVVYRTVDVMGIGAAYQKALASADPDNAAAYAANLESLNGRIDALDREIAETIAPVKDKPFIVFHDAYQYFEKHYGIRVAGSITVSPEIMPGAERVAEIHQKVKELGAACVFAEPQFEPKLIQVVTEGTAARSGTLDPEGAALTEGPDLYFELMRSIATSLQDCLSGA